MISILQRSKITDQGIEFEDKVEQALTVIKMHQVKEGYYLAFSGGKDSVVIYRLAQMAGVDFDAHYNMTTVDPPELVNFIRERYPDVEMSRPDMTMWELIPKKRMPPTRLVRYCCDVLKEREGDGRLVMTGIRAAESNARAMRCVFEQDNRKKDKFYLNPIIDWSDKDVWDFIKEQEIDYCSLYDEGFHRLGCIGCPMQGPKGMKRDFHKWPKFKASYIRAFERMIIARRENDLKTDWTTGEEVMNWWLNGNRPPKIAEGQEELKMMSNN